MARQAGDGCKWSKGMEARMNRSHPHPQPQPQECGLLPLSSVAAAAAVPGTTHSILAAPRGPAGRGEAHPKASHAPREGQSAPEPAHRGGAPVCDPTLLPSPLAPPLTPSPSPWRMYNHFSPPIPVPSPAPPHFPPPLRTPPGHLPAAAPDATAPWAPRPGDGTQPLRVAEAGISGVPPPATALQGRGASGEPGMIGSATCGTIEETPAAAAAQQAAPAAPAAAAATLAPSQGVVLNVPPHISRVPKAHTDAAIPLPLLSWQPGCSFPGAPLPSLRSLNPPPDHPLLRAPPGVPAVGPAALPQFSSLPRPCVAGLPRGPVMHPRLVSTLRDLICGAPESGPGTQAREQAQAPDAAKAEAATPGTPGSMHRPLTPPAGPSAPQPAPLGALGAPEASMRGAPGAEVRSTPVPSAAARGEAGAEGARGPKGGRGGGASGSRSSNSMGSSSGGAVAPLEALASSRSYSVGTPSALASPLPQPDQPCPRDDAPPALSPGALLSRAAHAQHLVNDWHRWRARNGGSGEGQGCGAAPRPLVAASAQPAHRVQSPMLPVGRTLFPSLEAAASPGAPSRGKDAPGAAAAARDAHPGSRRGAGAKGLTTAFAEEGAEDAGARAPPLPDHLSPPTTRARCSRHQHTLASPCWDASCLLHPGSSTEALDFPPQSHPFCTPVHPGTPQDHLGAFPWAVAAPPSPDSASFYPRSPGGAPQGRRDGGLSLAASPGMSQDKRRLLAPFPGSDGARLATAPHESPFGSPRLAPAEPVPAPARAAAPGASPGKSENRRARSPKPQGEGASQPVDSFAGKSTPGNPATSARQLAQLGGLPGGAPQGLQGRGLRLRRGRDDGASLGSPAGGGSPAGSGLSPGPGAAHRAPGCTSAAREAQASQLGSPVGGASPAGSSLSPGPKGAHGGAAGAQAPQLVASPGKEKGREGGAPGSRSPGAKGGGSKKSPSCCPECGRMFVGLYELRRHFGRKHMHGEKPFACAKCAKRFFVEADLRDHERACGTLLTCLRCGLHFAFKCNLNHHIRGKPACSAFYEDLRARDDAGSGQGRAQAVPAPGERGARDTRAGAGPGEQTDTAEEAGGHGGQAEGGQGGLGQRRGAEGWERAGAGADCKGAAEALHWGSLWGSPGQEGASFPPLSAPHSSEQSGHTARLEPALEPGPGSWRAHTAQGRGQKRPFGFPGMGSAGGDGGKGMQDLQQSRPAQGTRHALAMKR